MQLKGPGSSKNERYYYNNIISGGFYGFEINK